MTVDTKGLEAAIDAAIARAEQSEKTIAKLRVDLISARAEGLTMFQMLGEATLGAYETECPFCGVECGEEAEPPHEPDDCPMAAEDLADAMRRLITCAISEKSRAMAACAAADLPLDTLPGPLRVAIEGYRLAPHRAALGVGDGPAVLTAARKALSTAWQLGYDSRHGDGIEPPEAAAECVSDVAYVLMEPVRELAEHQAAHAKLRASFDELSRTAADLAEMGRRLAKQR